MCKLKSPFEMPCHDLEKTVIEFLDRTGTQSVKYDGIEEKFHTKDLIPLWVADADFATAPCISQALIKRAMHPIYGYTHLPSSFYTVFQQWLKKRYQWSVTKEEIIPTLGVVPTLYAAVQAFTKKGEYVIIQPPLYPHFAKAILVNERKIASNPLIYENNRYTIDFEGLESWMKKGAKLLLFCSPHNPTGRVWKKEELGKLLSLCRIYGVTIISDEIHADITASGVTHTPLGSLAPELSILTAYSPSKSFNIAGLGMGVVVGSPLLLQKLTHIFTTLHMESSYSPFGALAFQTAYEHAEEWLENMCATIDKNDHDVQHFLKDHHLPLLPVKREGTFLLWLDCHAMNLSPQHLRDFFIHDAKVGLSAGTEFGKEGARFMRLNLASSPSTLSSALTQILEAWKKRC